MTQAEQDIQYWLSLLPSITLDEMRDIKLMNRTDTKFVTNQEKLAQLLQLVQDDYYAQEVEGVRLSSYRTIYWDTPDHRFFLEHHNGRAPRQKIRMRSYQDVGLSFLEVKTKNNHGRTKKKRISIPSLDASVLEEAGGSDFTCQHTGLRLDDIIETVQNNFQRITLVNRGKTERLTIDLNVRFHNYETNIDAGTGNLVIIELKRDGNVYSPILGLLRQLRIQASGFSKYCIGSVVTNGHLKNNLFKPRLQKISKLTGTPFRVAPV